MANKRNLKKEINAIVSTLIGEYILTREFVPGVNAEKANNILVKIKELRIKRKIPAFPVNPVLRTPGGNALWLPGIRHSGELLKYPDEPGVMISAEKIKDFN